MAVVYEGKYVEAEIGLIGRGGEVKIKLNVVGQAVTLYDDELDELNQAVDAIANAIHALRQGG